MGSVIVSTLVEVQGGPTCWKNAETKFSELGWIFQKTSFRQQRKERRYFNATKSCCFYWVDVPVPGSRLGIEKRVGWIISDAARSARVALQDRRYVIRETDRSIQPSWQAYSTRHSPKTIRPTNVSIWFSPAWWILKAFYRLAIHVGLYDLKFGRVRAPSKEGALQAARELPSIGVRADVDVRPLDGWGRSNARLRDEGALKRSLTYYLCCTAAAGLLLCIAREAPLPAKILFGMLAIGCIAIGWWQALSLPLGRTRRTTVPGITIITLAILASLLGVPGVREGLNQQQALVLGLTSYYIIGLVFLLYRWHWHGLFVGALPVAATLAVSLLPVTRTLLHDMFGDELSLTSEETKVSTIWELAAAVQLLWPSFIAMLGVAAGWGILRYFHFVRGNTFPELLVLTVIALTAEIPAVDITLSSPREASIAVIRAAEDRSPAPTYFGLNPSWMCITPTVPPHKLNEDGGVLNKRTPYLTFGVIDNYAVLWNTDTQSPLRVPSNQVRLIPARPAVLDQDRCPHRRIY